MDGPANVFCDNEAVFKNSSIPESVLKKKHLSTCCHLVREAVTAGILRVAKEDGATNLSDVLTKIMTGPKKRQLLGYFMYS